jgi:CheY-like chemotaxis protein
MDPQQPTQSLCVLVVDDDWQAAEVWCLLLAQWGHRTLAAYDATAAWAVALAEKPDVVLLDIHLPGVDGWDLARRLRAEPVLEGINLIALTGDPDADREKSVPAEINWHLVKPVDPQLLQRLVVECGLQRGRRMS